MLIIWIVALMAIVLLTLACVELWADRPSRRIPESVMDAAAVAPTDTLEPPDQRLPGWYPARVPGQRGFRWWDPYANDELGEFTIYRGHPNDYTVRRWNYVRATRSMVAAAMGAVLVLVMALPLLLVFT